MKESIYNIWTERADHSYVFNGVSGAVLSIPNDDRRSLDSFLAGAEAPDCPPKLLEQMIRGYMLVPDDADEVEMLRERYELTRHDRTHFALTIVTSLGCNFDCPYCFEAKHPSILSPEVEEALLEALDDQLPNINRMNVTWFGGEPLVGKKPLLRLSDQFIERCERAGVAYTADIATNGYLLSEQTCVELRDRKVTSVQVCLDGPPDIHDRMRPLASGRGSFQRIVENLRHAVNYLDIIIRMNVDTKNFGRAEELLRILSDEGFAGKLGVYPGQLVGIDNGGPSPSATYRPRCFSNAEFARAELEFSELAMKDGFKNGPTLPRPSGAPCTAVRANELVVGSKGELYKCWDDVGHSHAVIGDIRDYKNPNGRLQRWMKYDPFKNEECRGCVALPVCMGGCAHHAMDILQHENRCGTFRHTYREQVASFVEFAQQAPQRPIQLAPLARRMETR